MLALGPEPSIIRGCMPRRTKLKNRRVPPGFVAPMLCKDVKELPASGEWLYEVKRDGRRAIAIKDGSKVTLLSRDGELLDCPEGGQALKQLPAKRIVIDCEIVALKANGSTNGRSREDLRLYAFDLLHVNGRDVMDEPIEKRKERLCSLTLDSSVLFCPSLNCEPELLVEEVKRLALEAVIAKKKGSTYEPGACNGAWVQLRV
jgi:bifunctional non-homologous end joining protein LigD